jgi:large subunit ribosomal protein L18
MNARKKLNQKRLRRARRSSARIVGTTKRPRLAVHRTNRFIYVQLIDDTQRKTLVAASDVPKKGKAGSKEKLTKTASAEVVGAELGRKAVALGVSQAVFDRRSYRFHGRVKSVAEGAKKSGLKI